MNLYCAGPSSRRFCSPVQAAGEENSKPEFTFYQEKQMLSIWNKEVRPEATVFDRRDWNMSSQYSSFVRWYN